MQLSAAQLEEFGERGFLVLENLFSAAEVARLRAEQSAILAEDCAANIREKLSGEVRTAMGLHLRNPVFDKLARHPRLLGPAMQIAGDRLYIQQVKVNAKAPFTGEVWQWHYDFATHHREDGVPQPLALNLHVFLDDVGEFNGPLWFIPGSQKGGPVETALDQSTTSYDLWTVADQQVGELVAAGGMVSVTGPAGTGLIFGDCLVHGSPANMSPWSRWIFSLIVNPVANAATRHRRPDYKHHRDLTPIEPLADDCLIAGELAPSP